MSNTLSLVYASWSAILDLHILTDVFYFLYFSVVVSVAKEFLTRTAGGYGRPCRTKVSKVQLNKNE